MNIFYGIVFIIFGTWMITIQVKKLAIKKTIYFTNIFDMLLGIGCVVVGAILAIRNKSATPYAWLLYAVLIVIGITRLIRAIVKKITYELKPKK